MISHSGGSYVALRDILTEALTSPVSFLKKRIKTKEAFWALEDINFEAMPGETIGIIGRNGAGKSTLLKILSQITPPSTGEVRIHGRVGSLLEVGTGFHPELTGRENIFLNGAILGMKKQEIIAKFNRIVSFAGIEKFLDTPVKYYSSGMYVRLAFSVAAHLEPDILIIDEVLAVGDAEFQKKCLGKMEDITKNEGRTILFVSHNLEAVKQLCTKCIWIDQGKVQMIGSTEEVLEAYTNERQVFKQSNEAVVFTKTSRSQEVIFKKLWATDASGATVNLIPHDQDLIVHVEFEVQKDTIFTELTLTFKNSNDTNVISTSLSESANGRPRDFKKGTYHMTARIHKNFLVPDTYSIRVWAHERGVRDIEVLENAMKLKIADNGSSMAHYGPAAIRWASVLADTDWDIHEV